MKEITIIQGFKAVGDKIQKMERARQGVDQEIVAFRLQINAIIRVIRWLFPLNFIFRYLVKKEFNIYTQQLEEGKKQLEDMKQKMINEARPARANKVKRNEKCSCGSGKKYKKCCLSSDSVKNNPNI